MKHITTPPFEVELVKDISNDDNIIEVSTSKYMNEGEYCIIFEVIGNDKTIVSDMNEFMRIGLVQLLPEKTPTDMLSKESIQGHNSLRSQYLERDKRDFLIPFEDR